MKHRFPIWILYFGLLMVSFPSLLLAQKPQHLGKIRPTYIAGKDTLYGTFGFSIQIIRGENGPVETLGKVSKALDMKGAESGILRFVFYTDEIVFKARDHRKKYQLILRPRCHSGAPEIQPISKEDIVVKYSKESNEKVVEYAIKANGSGGFSLSYDLVKEGEEGTNCSQSFAYNYSVTNMASPAARECEEALAEFHSPKKMTAIGWLKIIQVRYPNAPCISKIEDILAQNALYERVKVAPCAEVQTICKDYTSKYGPNGEFSVEISPFCKCTTSVRPPPPPPVQQPKAPDQAQIEKNEFEKIGAENDPATIPALLAFIEKWSAANPGSQYVQKAKNRIAALSPLEYERLADLPNGSRQYRLINAKQPRLKNMSLQSGLELGTDRLLSENIFTAIVGQGEYNVMVIDANGKQANIKITNEFGAALAPLPDGSGWLLRVNGGQTPYRVYLADAANPKDEKTLRGNLKSDTLLILQADLKKRGYDKSYQVVVRDGGRPARQFNAGPLEGVGDNGGTALLDIIMVLLLLFTLLCVAYGLYLLNSQKKARKQKATIYDRIQ